MKNVFYFALVVILITLVSATTVSVMTVKPQLPKTTAIICDVNSECQAKEAIIPYIKKGYIVKFISSSGQYGSHWLIIMEKY